MPGQQYSNPRWHALTQFPQESELLYALSAIENVVAVLIRNLQPFRNDDRCPMIQFDVGQVDVTDTVPISLHDGFARPPRRLAAGRIGHEERGGELPMQVDLRTGRGIDPKPSLAVPVKEYYAGRNAQPVPEIKDQSVVQEIPRRHLPKRLADFVLASAPA